VECIEDMTGEIPSAGLFCVEDMTGELFFAGLFCDNISWPSDLISTCDDEEVQQTEHLVKGTE
jgi:hypothetical protein